MISKTVSHYRVLERLEKQVPTLPGDSTFR